MEKGKSQMCHCSPLKRANVCKPDGHLSSQREEEGGGRGTRERSSRCAWNDLLPDREERRDR